MRVGRRNLGVRVPRWSRRESDYFGRASSVLAGAALGHTAPRCSILQGNPLPTDTPAKKEVFPRLSKVRSDGWTCCCWAIT